MAVALDHGGGGHGQALADAGVDAPLQVGAGLQALRIRQVGIHGAGAGARIDAGADRAHLADDRGAVAGRQFDAVAGRDPGEFGFGQFGAPLQPALADQPQQFAAGGNHLAGLHQPPGDHPCIGGTQVGEAAAQGRGIAHCPCGADARIALHPRRAQFIHLGRADVLVLHQQFAARQLGTRQRRAGLRLAQRCVGLCKVGIQAAMVELQQQVALAHLLADVNQQVVDPQAADFDAELHFFPRRHRPGHQHAARDVPRLHAHHADREGRNRLGGLFILLAAGGGDGGHAKRESEGKVASGTAHAQVRGRQARSLARM